jgi:hypothetical protein
MQLVEILDNIGNSRAFLRGRSALSYTCTPIFQREEIFFHRRYHGGYISRL